MTSLKTTSQIMAVAIISYSVAAGAATYREIRQDCAHLTTGEKVIAIRELVSDKSQDKMNLVVQPQTLETKFINGEELNCENYENDSGRFSDSEYEKALNKFSVDPSGRNVNANQGLRSFSPSCAAEALKSEKAPIALTIDLCPAKSTPDSKHPHRPFDRDYFRALQRIGRSSGVPVEATVFISGSWIRSHATELSELKAFNNPAQGLKITFGNHSNTHPYLGNQVPSSQNFMTQMTADVFKNEVLETEKKMLLAGITPSIFFRFPGLMSNAQELAQLRELGLIAVGTSAWVAVDGGTNVNFKGFQFSTDQAVKPGRIALTHGNGNEERGVRGAYGFLDYLERNRTSTLVISLNQAVRCAR